MEYKLSARLARLALFGGLGCTATALQAGTLDFGNGVEGVWSLNASLSSGWRASNADSDLIGIGDGGTGSAYTGSADKNFGKGANFSNLARVIGDMDVHSGNFGAMVRAKLWYDFRLKDQSVSLGAPSNGFSPDSKLSDSQFDTNQSKFSGAELLDAYVYGSFDLSDSSQVKVRLGQHVVNFGESLFIPGVNQYQVLDITALRQPGTLLKEAILPVPQISANLGLAGGVSLEGFYQLKWERTVIDGCGTYWSPATALNCTKGSTLVANDGTPLGPMSSNAFWTGNNLANANFQFAVSGDRTPSDYGQFGLALKKSVEAIDTEFGLYYVQYTTHLPNLSGQRDLSSVPGSIYSAAPFGSVFWDYDAKKTKVGGLSASTVLGGWAVNGEMSYTTDFPVQINSVDGFAAMVQNAGPMASRWGFTAAPLGSGAYNEGRDYKNRFQVQASTLKLFQGGLGASSISLLGEVAYQHWTGIGDPYTSVRYGRGFEYGAAQAASFGGLCPAQTSNPANCTMDGYFTSDAWGLRALVEFEYPNLIPYTVVKPRLFVSSDVKGWSADGMFSQGRYALTPGVKFDWQKRYSLDLSYSHFNPNARFDSFHDRDFLALVLGASF